MVEKAKRLCMESVLYRAWTRYYRMVEKAELLWRAFYTGPGPEI